MPLWLHSGLMAIAFFVGSLGGGILGIVGASSLFLPNGGEPTPPRLFLIVLFTFSCFIAGALFPQYIFKRFIPARCPTCRRGRTVICNFVPVTYECKVCGATHKTSLSFGED